jgi:hypothetical protein
VSWRLVNVIAFSVLAALGPAGSASAAPSAPAAEAVTNFSPQGIVVGTWRAVSGAEPYAVSAISPEGCRGTARSWERDDGVQLRLSWAWCGAEDLADVMHRFAVVRGQTRDEWRAMSALPANADAVAPLPANRIGRGWIEAGYVLSLTTSCGPLPVRDCAEVSGLAARHLSERLPGEASIDTAQVDTLVPPISELTAGLVVAWLLLVGGRMLSIRVGRERFVVNPCDPRVRDVSSAATHLRLLHRLRRCGHGFATVSVILVLLGVLLMSDGRAAAGVGWVAVAGGCAAAAVAFIRRGGHPLLDLGWMLRYRRVARMRPKRAAAVLLTVVLGLFTIALPVLALVGVVVAYRVTSLADTRAFFGYGLVIAAAVGFLLDRAAQQLRACDAREMGRDDRRPFLLYLRNFADDRLRLPASGLSRRGPWQVLTGWLNPIRTARFEETLTRALAHHGPLIAVDPPESKLHRLGAAKATLRGEWQPYVGQWANLAHAVVLSLTPSIMGEGLRWELKMVAERVPHGRVVLVTGPWKQGDLPGYFGLFLRETEPFPLFTPLADPWVTSGLLVFVHAPAHGWGTWFAWGTEHRTEWTYSAAIDEALLFARHVWAAPQKPRPASPPHARVERLPTRPEPAAASQDQPAPRTLVAAAAITAAVAALGVTVYARGGLTPTLLSLPVLLVLSLVSQGWAARKTGAPGHARALALGGSATALVLGLMLAGAVGPPE